MQRLTINYRKFVDKPCQVIYVDHRKLKPFFSITTRVVNGCTFSASPYKAITPITFRTNLYKKTSN